MTPTAKFVRGHAGAAAAVLGATLALAAIDRSLAALEASELAREAREEYAAGQRSMEAARPRDAAVRFGRAHALQRNNRGYRLALASAWAAAGQFDRAEREIEAVLDVESNDGEANLAMARLAARTARPNEADAYYHRAVYGSWRGDANAKRRAARVEMAEFLASQERPEELLAEALVLQTEAGDDPAMARRVAGWFLRAGSAGRAVASYREIVRAHPDDAEALRGLAEAELASGDFRRSQTTWLRIVQSNPGDAAAAKRLQFAASLERMDPTPRRLRTVEKLRRSEALFAAVRSRVAACRGAEAAGEPAPGREPATSPKAAKNEDAESLISEAEKLWASRPPGCRVAPDDPVPVLMQKVGST